MEMWSFSGPEPEGGTSCPPPVILVGPKVVLE